MEHAPGVVQKDSAVVRVGLAMAVMDKWVLRTIIHASLEVSNNQSLSAARGLRYQKWPFAKEQCFGGFGGFPPPILGRTGPGA